MPDSILLHAGPGDVGRLLNALGPFAHLSIGGIVDTASGRVLVKLKPNGSENLRAL